MSTHGIILIDIVAAACALLIINLVRTKRLYVGYGVMWLLPIGAMMLTISVPPLLRVDTRAVGALFPASALSLLAFVFIFSVLIYVTVKLSTLSARQTELIQQLAIRQLREGFTIGVTSGFILGGYAGFADDFGSSGELDFDGPGSTVFLNVAFMARLGSDR